MFYNLHELQKYHLRGQDGETFGEIKSFVIDDFDWVIRYIVLSIDNRTVLLSRFTFGSPDPIAKVIPITVNQEKIINSPELDLSGSLSRDIERKLSDYYEWPYYWEPTDVPNTLPGDLSAVPLIDMQLDREAQEEMELIPQTGDPRGTLNHDDSHLRSTKVIFGQTVHTSNDDRNDGKLVDMVTQDGDWSVLYLVIDTNDLLSSHKVLVSPSWVERIDEINNRIDIKLSSETIHKSPEFSSIVDLTKDYQNRLDNYYNQQ